MPRSTRLPARTVLAVLMILQVTVLYAPAGAGGGLWFPGLDKVVHATLFGLPAAWALSTLKRPQWVLVALLVHAPLSEIVQSRIGGRTGDGADAAADLVGLMIGSLCGVHARRRKAPQVLPGEGRSHERFGPTGVG